MRTKAPLWYTVQAIIGTMLEEAVLVAIVLWVLPYFGIHIPLWGLIILMIALAIVGYVSYRIGKLTFLLKPRVAPEAGSEGKVVTPLTPQGYVKVQGVLWKATCFEQGLETGDEVVVVGVDGLRLIVAAKGRPVQYKQIQR